MKACDNCHHRDDVGRCVVIDGPNTGRLMACDDICSEWFGDVIDETTHRLEQIAAPR